MSRVTPRRNKRGVPEPFPDKNHPLTLGTVKTCGRREVRCQISTNLGWLLGSREGGQNRKEGFVVGESQMVHLQPEIGGGVAPAQPTPVIQLRLDRRPTNPTPFLWAPRGSGGFVYESSSLLPQPSPKPASRVAWVLWEGETGPAPARPPFFSFPFLPPAFAVDTGEGRYFFQTC